MNVREALLKISDLPLVHRADFLAAQLEEICCELNIELCIGCDSASLQIHERITGREKAVVYSYEGQPWIRFESEQENTPA